MAYDAEFVEGFDKYGAATLGNPWVFPGRAGFANLPQMLLSGEWNGVNDTGTSALTVFIAPPLSGPSSGQSLQTVRSPEPGQPECWLQKILAANYVRIIGGFTFNWGASGGAFYIINAGTVQVSIFVNSFGQIVVNRGNVLSGTTLATSLQVVPVSSTAVLEFDVTIDPSAGIVKIWLNGTLTSINLTGQNTSADSTTHYNTIGIGGTDSHSQQWDHLYNHYFLASGSGDTPLLYGPIVVTQFPVSDASVAFVPELSILGEAACFGSNAPVPSATPGANTLFLRQFKPQANMTLNSVTCLPHATSSVANFQAVVYADSAGTPAALLSTGPQVTGCTANLPLSGNLTTPQALTAGTNYWIGFITDTAVALNLNRDTILASSAVAANTYTSGAPSPAPLMTYNQLDWAIWGQCTSSPSNFCNVNSDPANVPVAYGQSSGNAAAYNQSSTVNAEDLFNFPALPSGIAEISTVAVKVLAAVPDGGVRTMTVQTKSVATDESSAAASLSNSFLFIPGYFDVDPNTTDPWTPSGVNAATSGYKIAS